MSANLAAAPLAASQTAGPVLELSLFVNRHGKGLCDLVDILDDAVAIDAFCDLAATHASTRPCPIVSLSAIDKILESLSDVSLSDADRLARNWNIDIDTAARWYGARLTDLRAKFPDIT